MLISTRGRYALRVLVDLAEHNDGGHIPMKDVATRQELSLKYLLRLIEGTLAPVSCLECGTEPCERASECRTLEMWKGFFKLTNEYFDGITIADLMKNKVEHDYII